MKRIAIMDVDHFSTGKNNYPNLALMKIAGYHLAKGDEVDFYNPMDEYDVLYMSKVFTHTPDYPYLIHNAAEIIQGGTGYDVHSVLPPEIDRAKPAYDMFGVDHKTAYGFTTRGCIRKCKWCIVPVKEGRVRPYMDVDDIAIDGRTNLIMMDNNILASEYGIEQIRKIIKKKYRVDFNQGLDARLVTPEIAELLSQVRFIDGVIRFAADTKAEVKHVRRVYEMINRKGLHFNIFTMLHGSEEECVRRVDAIRSLGRNIVLTAQPMQTLDSKTQEIPQWQKDLSRYCFRREIFYHTSVYDYFVRDEKPFAKYRPKSALKKQAFFGHVQGTE